jgi:hypothetical protein
MVNQQCKYCQCDYTGDVTAWLNCELDHIGEALQGRDSLDAEHARLLLIRLRAIKRRLAEMIGQRSDSPHSPQIL